MLPSLLNGAGLEHVDVAARQVCRLEGEGKRLGPLTLERIVDSVVSEGMATTEEVAELVAELYDYCAGTTTVFGGPRIVQAWGAAVNREA